MSGLQVTELMIGICPSLGVKTPSAVAVAMRSLVQTSPAVVVKV
jgi:hypothetical protein